MDSGSRDCGGFGPTDIEEYAADFSRIIGNELCETALHSDLNIVMSKKGLVVISYYDRRPIHNLLELIHSISQYPAGGEFDICVVVNRTKDEEVRLPAEFAWIPVEYRHNVGMNIGAWDHGWRTHQGYQDYLFLQDQCYVVRENWLGGYRSVLENPEVGMVGESLNMAWDEPWAELRKLAENWPLPEHTIGGKPVNRADFYLSFFREHEIYPGQTGKHLRSVIWFVSAAVLGKIDGFLVGRNYGECIAAEITASKKVEALGLQVVQADKEEFFYIRDLEYNQDRPGAPYTHNAKYVNYASVHRILKVKDAEIHELKSELHRLKRKGFRAVAAVRTGRYGFGLFRRRLDERH